MKTQVLICDDSSFARKAIARSLPDGWDVDIAYAEHGEEAIELVKEGRGDILFLDLNMPVLDGYETMDIIRMEDLPTMVIVVSGDVQEEARNRMLALGAIDFIRKPIDNHKLSEILAHYGIYNGETSSTQRRLETPLASSSPEDKLDAFRELANVAMGKAGESLSALLGEFIKLPIPNVSLLHSNELHMALHELDLNSALSAVSKGFVSPDISGEALILFNDANIQAMRELLERGEAPKLTDDTAPSEHANRKAQDVEVLMDVSNILIGACLQALSEQLTVKFTHNPPIILGVHCELAQIVKVSQRRQHKLLAIEIAYAIEKNDINFELLLLIPDTHIEKVFNRLVLDKDASHE